MSQKVSISDKVKTPTKDFQLNKASDSTEPLDHNSVHELKKPDPCFMPLGSNYYKAKEIQ